MTDQPEIKAYLQLLYKIAAIMLISILGCFAIGLWIGQKINRAGVGACVGTGLGLCIGFYVLFTQIKKMK